MPLPEGSEPLAAQRDVPVPVPVAQVQHLALLPSISWDYPCPANLRYLSRQRLRAETELGLEAVIVQDERGFLALWTGYPRDAQGRPRDEMSNPAGKADEPDEKGMLRFG